jgi:hypothetical protein
MVVLLKLVLVPALLALASGVSRRWGHGAGGWVTALPIIAGPIVLIMTLEHGAAFGAQASRGTLLGLVYMGLFCVVYARLARRAAWPACLAAGWAVVALTTPLLALLALLRLDLWPSLALVLAVLMLSYRMLPPARAAGGSVPGAREIGWRMVAGVAMVLFTTSLAQWLGPRLSGLAATFPIGITVMAVFSHRFHGEAAAIGLMRAVVPGLASFAVFFVVCALVLERLGAWRGFAAASAITLAAHALLMCAMWRLSRRAPQLASAPPIRQLV